MILQDRIYYFEQISQPEETDVVFELKALELGSVMNRISTGLPGEQCLTPDSRGRCRGRVLFSFGSPSGSGMGITDPVRQKNTGPNGTM